MSKRRAYSQATLDTMERFFLALETCVEHKIIKNASRYCTENGIAKEHFYSQRKYLYKGYFEVSWMIPLVTRYGISPRWLLTGEGLMFDSSAVTINLRQPTLFD